MADIQIKTTKDEDDKLIRSTSSPNGFYMSQLDMNTGGLWRFFNREEGWNESEIEIAKGNRINLYFTQIQMSYDTTQKESIDKTSYGYSKELTHESGHYLLGFYDEYEDNNSNEWGTENKRPYDNFGLMDNPFKDIEISKTNKDYAYLSSNSIMTEQYKERDSSCEEYLATNLENVTDSPYCFTSKYKADYTKAETYDRRAAYGYAENIEFIPGTDNNANTEMFSTQSVNDLSTAIEVNPDYFEDIADASTAIDGILYQGTEAGITLSLTPQGNITYYAFVEKVGEQVFTKYAFTANGDDLSTTIPVTYGDIAEIKILAESQDNVEKTTIYLEHTAATDTGYYYKCIDGTTIAYFTNDETANYTVVSEHSPYQNGDYVSINPAFSFSNDQNVAVTGGEIYSVASCTDAIDYTSVSWFKYADGQWTALETDYSTEENLNIGARADLDGPGMYVLMAKTASTETAAPVTDLTYTQSNEIDAHVTLSFSDSNTNTKYYNVYYSDTDFTDKTADNVAARTYEAGSTELEIDLQERGKTVYAGVETVLENGAVSELVKITIVSGEADRDEDGIPDWYCDKYFLWPTDEDETEGSISIAYRDNDGDGILNIKEYRDGTNPMDPNDPVVTLYYSVESVSLNASEVALNVDETVQLSETVIPEKVTNKAVTWTSSDESIATVDANGLVTAVSIGAAVITCTSDEDTSVYANCDVKVVGYLSFTAVDDSVTIDMNFTGTPADFTLEYALSTDGPWNTFAVGGSTKTANAVTLNEGETMYVRSSLDGENAIKQLSLDADNYAQFTMSGTGTIHANGNIMSILDNSCSLNEVGEFAFYNLFRSCTRMTTVPKLPAKTLAKNCYAHMFYGCTALTTASELPATTLADGCYCFMFYGCTSLTSAPNLPATTLTSGCYEKLFYGCSKLQSVNVGFTDWGTADNATTDWLKDVSSTGTITVPVGLDTTQIGSSYIPEGWTINKIVADGDVNLDGKLDIEDSKLAKRIAMKEIVANAAQLAAGDLDGNGIITINEARKIKRAALGEIEL